MLYKNSRANCLSGGDIHGYSFSVSNYRVNDITSIKTVCGYCGDEREMFARFTWTRGRQSHVPTAAAMFCVGVLIGLLAAYIFL